MAANPPFTDGEIPSSAKWNTLVGVHDRSPTAVDVVSSVAETTIYTCTIGAGHLSSDRALELFLSGDILQNASASATLRIKFGATTLWGNSIGAPLSTNDVDRRPWSLVVSMQNINSASVQELGGTFFLGDASSASVAGLGSQFVSNVMPLQGTAAENSAGALAFAVTVQWNTSSANASWRKKQGKLRLD